MVTIRKEEVQESKKIVERKRAFWESIIPVSFDEYGRAKIKEKDEVVYDVEKYLKGQCIQLSESFIKAFNLYLNNKKLSFLSTRGFVSEIKDGTDIIVQNLNKNRFLLFDGQKNIPIKASKVLAGVQEIWKGMFPKYDQIIKDIRNVPVSERKDGYYNSLKLQKIMLDKGNLYVLYQEILNKQSHRELFISINPLDLLTCSGTEEYEQNLTKFETCISLDMIKEDNGLTFMIHGEHSSPEETLLLGKICNVGLIFQKNGYSSNVPDTDFSFLGYSARSKCWLDDRGIWVEKFYPYEYYLDDLIAKDIPIIKEGKDVMFTHKHDFGNLLRLQDTDAIREFYEYSSKCPQTLYFDRVGINGNHQVYFLPVFRTEYDDSGLGFDNPYDEGYNEYYSDFKEDEEIIKGPEESHLNFNLGNRLNDFIARLA